MARRAGDGLGDRRPHLLKAVGKLTGIHAFDGGIHAVRRPRSEQEWDALAVSVQAMVCAP